MECGVDESDEVLLACSDACHHLGGGQIFATTYASRPFARRSPWSESKGAKLFGGPLMLRLSRFQLEVDIVNLLVIEDTSNNACYYFKQLDPSVIASRNSSLPDIIMTGH